MGPIGSVNISCSLSCNTENRLDHIWKYRLFSLSFYAFQAPKFAQILFLTIIALWLIGLVGPSKVYGRSNYLWLATYDAHNALAHRVLPPRGFVRTHESPRSFAHWLRYLPLKPGKGPVMLFNGEKKTNQTAHWAIVDMDVGNRDLQQCADAVIRLHAEYLFASGQLDRIRYRFTSGDLASYDQWKQGYRPVVRGNHVVWRQKARPDGSYTNFRNYLNTVFMYAGSWSLSQELKPVSVDQMRIGDVFVQGGFPGHAVTVCDMAIHHRTGQKVFLLLQSYMPAQDVHILRNGSDPQLSPWYPLAFGKILQTPEWRFTDKHLKRFP